MPTLDLPPPATTQYAAVVAPATSTASMTPMQALVDACAATDWVGVHAAEALIALGRPGSAYAAFASRAASAEPKIRVGIWRVLARCDPDAGRRDAFVARIRAALVDGRGPDRAHALEALAKLGEPIAGDAERAIVDAMADDAAVAPFALWRLAQPGAIGRQAVAVDRLIECLRGPDDVGRARAAYALGRLGEGAAALREALAGEPTDSPAHVPLCVAVGGDAARALVHDASPGARYAGAMWLADHGAAADRPSIDRLRRDADPDVRVAAAFAAIRLSLADSTQPTEQQR